MRSRVRVRNLSPRMDTSIRSPGKMPAYAFARQHGPGAFQFALHRARVALELRPRECGAVVLERQRDVAGGFRSWPCVRACPSLDQLDHDHFGRVAFPRSQFRQPDVAPRPVDIVGRNLQQPVRCTLRST